MCRFAFLVVILIACYGSNMQIQGECSMKYKFADPNHTQCLKFADLPGKTGSLSEEEKAEILARHNKYRSEARSRNMIKIKWNAEIALSAQKFAATCIAGHDTFAQRVEPGKFDVGQNWAGGSTTKSWSSFVDQWAAEIVNFPLDGVWRSVNSGGYSNYSQVVWAETSLVGCGYADCTKDGKTVRHFVCNYAPPGNNEGKEIYKWGAGCTECGGSCWDNLCDCGSANELNMCMNKGTLTLETCSCECKNYMWYDYRQSCKLKTCPSKEDEKISYICKQYGHEQYCKLVPYMQIECPTTCNICPYALEETRGTRRGAGKKRRRH